jgi:hypothetical protein
MNAGNKPPAGDTASTGSGAFPMQTLRLASRLHELERISGEVDAFASPSMPISRSTKC